MRLKSVSSFISANTCWPFIFGRFRSRRTTSGRGPLCSVPDAARRPGLPLRLPRCASYSAPSPLSEPLPSGGRLPGCLPPSTRSQRVCSLPCEWRSFHFFPWKAEVQGRTFLWLRLQPNPAPLALHDLFASSQADGGTKKMVLGIDLPEYKPGKFSFYITRLSLSRGRHNTI